MEVWYIVALLVLLAASFWRQVLLERALHSIKQRLSSIEDNVVRQIMEEDENLVAKVLDTHKQLCNTGMSTKDALFESRRLHGMRN